MKQTLIFITLLFTPLLANAWNLFGPKNYDDCILEGMKGVTSDLAARNIMNSCREKFPSKSLSCEAQELNQLERKSVTDKGRVWSSAGTHYFDLELYNGMKNKAITEITVEISAKTINPPQKYKMQIRGYSIPSKIDPYSNGKAYVTTQKVEGNVRYTILSIKACNQ